MLVIQIRNTHQRYLAGVPSVNSVTGALFTDPFIIAKYEEYSYVGYRSGYIETIMKKPGF